MTTRRIMLNHPPEDSAYGVDKIPTPEKRKVILIGLSLQQNPCVYFFSWKLVSHRKYNLFLFSKEISADHHHLNLVLTLHSIREHLKKDHQINLMFIS